jgi:hypothetical protein
MIGRDPNDTPENRTAQIFAVMVKFIRILKNNNNKFRFFLSIG